MSTKILIVCSSLNVAGGLERMIVSFANQLCSEDFSLTVFISEETKASFYPIDSSVRVINKQLNFGITPKGNIITRKVRFIMDVVSLKELFKRERPDIIINTEYKFTVAAILSKAHKKSKVISWEHGDFFGRKSEFWKFFIRLTYKKVDAIVCLNEDERRLYERFKNKRVEIIPNFIRIPDKVNEPKEKVILTVARLVPAKGLNYLMIAAKAILSKYKDWRWKVIGSGILETELESFIKENHLENQLLLIPAQSPYLDNEFAKASIYALTSLHERLPMVLIEAMSNKTPCVAFDCETGPRHIIKNNVDGFLIEKEDSEKFIEAICRLIEDKEKRDKMGFAAFNNIKRFTDQVVITNWKNLFKELLKNN